MAALARRTFARQPLRRKACTAALARQSLSRQPLRRKPLHGSPCAAGLSPAMRWTRPVALADSRRCRPTTAAPWWASTAPRTCSAGNREAGARHLRGGRPAGVAHVRRVLRRGDVRPSLDPPASAEPTFAELARVLRPGRPSRHLRHIGSPPIWAASPPSWTTAAPMHATPASRFRPATTSRRRYPQSGNPAVPRAAVATEPARGRPVSARLSSRGGRRAFENTPAAIIWALPKPSRARHIEPFSRWPGVSAPAVLDSPDTSSSRPG
jgi:hypothetical protein